MMISAETIEMTMLDHQARVDHLRAVIAELEASQARWVKCSERMPISSKDVPVLVDAGCGYTMEVGYAVCGAWQEIYC